MLPFMGIIFFFLPNLLSIRNSKEVYYLQILKFFSTCMYLATILFTYMFFEDLVGGKKSISIVLDELKSVILIIFMLYASLFFLALIFGFFWKRVLSFDKIHLQVLINQFSLPLIALGLLTLSFYIYYSDQIDGQKDAIQWYQLLILPALITIPWAFHIYGLVRMANEKEMAFPKFLYFYERTRLESPESFWGLQTYSRSLGKWVILIPLCLLLFYQLFEKWF